MFQLRTLWVPSPPYLGRPGNQIYSLRNFVVFLKNLEAFGEVLLYFFVVFSFPNINSCPYNLCS